MSKTVEMPLPRGVVAVVNGRFDTDERVLVIVVDDGAERALADALTEAAKGLT